MLRKENIIVHSKWTLMPCLVRRKASWTDCWMSDKIISSLILPRLFIAVFNLKSRYVPQMTVTSIPGPCMIIEIVCLTLHMYRNLKLPCKWKNQSLYLQNMDESRKTIVFPSCCGHMGPNLSRLLKVMEFCQGWLWSCMSTKVEPICQCKTSFYFWCSPNKMASFRVAWISPSARVTNMIKVDISKVFCFFLCRR